MSRTSHRHHQVLCQEARSLDRALPQEGLLRAGRQKPVKRSGCEGDLTVCYLLVGRGCVTDYEAGVSDTLSDIWVPFFGFGAMIGFSLFVLTFPVPRY